jgi:hypothetical protein
MHRSSIKVLVILVGFYFKVDCSRHIFEKSLDIKCHENSSTESRVVSCGRIDRQASRHDDNSRFSQLSDNA